LVGVLTSGLPVTREESPAIAIRIAELEPVLMAVLLVICLIGAGIKALFRLLTGEAKREREEEQRRWEERRNVLSSKFVFKVGGHEYEMPTGASMWLPRDIPRVWANIGDSEGKLILMCFPSGFEKFFEEMGSEMLTVPPGSPAANQKMKDVMAKYGMEWLGPPICNIDQSERCPGHSGLAVPKGGDLRHS